MRRLRVGASATAKTTLREPTTLALLVVLPPMVVAMYGAAMASFPDVGFLSGSGAAYGRLSGALFATAFLSGLVGLFGTVSAARADRYLAFSGYPAAALFGTRVAVSCLVAGVAALTSLAALVAYGMHVASLPRAFVVLALAGVLYALVGVVVGALVPRELEGSLLLVFLADMDSFLSGDVLDIDAAVVDVMPLHAPHAAFTAAVQNGTLPTDDVFTVVASLVVAGVAAGVAYAAATNRGWSV